MKQLTPKQEAFAQHYALHGNATEAYKEAGYSWKRMKSETLHVKASKMLNSDKVGVRVAELKERVQKRAEDKFDLTADKLLRHYMAIAFANASDFYTWDADKVTIKSSQELTEEQLSIIQHVQEKSGKDKTIEIRLSDRMKAMDALARHLGIFEVDNAQQGQGPVQIVLAGDDLQL